MNGSNNRRASTSSSAPASGREDRRSLADYSERGEYRRMQNDMQVLTFKVRVLEEKINNIVKETGIDLRNGPGVRGISFTARLTSNTTVHSHQPIVFDDVLSNRGEAYDQQTGIFKVPVTGRYLFSLTIRAQYQKQACAEIVAEPMVIGQVAAGDSEIERATSSLTVMASLDEGDEVHVREIKTWTGYFFGEGYTVFTGVLLDECELYSNKTTMNQSEFKALKGTVGMRLEQKGEFKRLQEEVTSLISKIAHLEQKTALVMKCAGIRLENTELINDSGVAFSASMTSHTFLKADDILKFDDILVNAGRSYNPGTGKFVAPVSGRYMFSLTARAQFHKRVSSEIVGKGRVLGRITSGYGAIERATTSVTVVAKLAENDIVFVRQTNEKSGDYHGNGYTSFMGVLLE